MINDQINTDNFDRDIIVRFLEGYASKEEESVLNLWLNSSKENKAEFTEIQEIWNMTSISKEMEDLNVDADWNLVSSKLTNEASVNTTISNDQINTDHFDRDIIVRFLEGYATKEEESALNKWLNSSKENKTEYSEIQEIWNMTLISKEMEDLNIEADWNLVSAKLKGDSSAKKTSQTKSKKKKKTSQHKKKPTSKNTAPPKQEAKIKRLNFTKWASGIAAALALLAGAYFIFQNAGGNTDFNGQARTMVLSDGTKVWINSDGKVTAPEKFNNNERIVYLTGEAFFDVAHDAKRPFKIVCVNSQIEVLGTAFNVRTNDRITDVVVEEGQVKLTNEQRGVKSVIINPGEAGMANILGVNKIPNNRPNYHSWRTGKFNFDNTPLKFAVRDINGWFDKEIILSGNFDCNVTASFNKTDQESIIESLKGPCNFKVLEYPNDPKQKNKIYLKKIN